MSWRRAKTSGWASFDPKKQHEEVTNNQTHKDPYPPISSNINQIPLRNCDVTGRSFTSVLSPNFVQDLTTNKSIENDVSQKLKEIHPWANENLIEDIVTAVDNDIDKASALLREMATPKKKEIGFENNIEEVNTNDLQTTSFPESTKFSDHAYSREVCLDNDVRLGFIINSLNMLPTEPEWEDDDLYLMHRKEAIKATRLASRHSKAATEAYLRRDHTAAQEFSLKAQQEWSNSQKLNAKAAKEIFAMRNSENNGWKLDLHGLHASEAVQVLQEHLLKIEATHSKKPNLEVRSDIQQQTSGPRLLEVITGKGSHSRGQAALPVAIRSFLSEKGYFYFEARIGVITVQPKFRQISSTLSNR